MAALHGKWTGFCIKEAWLPGLQVSTATRSLQQELAHRDCTIRALEVQVAQLQASAWLPGQELDPVPEATAACPSQSCNQLLPVAADTAWHPWCDNLFPGAPPTSCDLALWAAAAPSDGRQCGQVAALTASSLCDLVFLHHVQSRNGRPEQAAAFSPAETIRIDLRPAAPEAQAGDASAGASSSLTAGSMASGAHASTAVAGGASGRTMMEGGDMALTPLSLNQGTASPKRRGASPASKVKVAGAALPGHSPASTQVPAKNASAAGIGFAAQAGLWEGRSRKGAEGRGGKQPALSPQVKMPQRAADGRQDMQPGQGLVMPRCAGGGAAHGSGHGASPGADAGLTPGSMLEASPSAGVAVAGGSPAVGGGRRATPSAGASAAVSGRLSATPHGGTPPVADPAAAGAGSLPLPTSASSVRCRSCPVTS